MKIKPYKAKEGDDRILVEVRWEDTTSYHGWQEFDVAFTRRPIECFSLGYLLLIDKKRVLIAMSAADSVGEIMAFPLGWVKGIRRLK